MSLKHAILGFLEFQPRSGYDLKKEFERSVAHFWPAQHSQIYGTLARLQDGGLVTVELVPQTGKPDRKVYTITSAGEHELRAWLLDDTIPLFNRSAFQIQTFFLGILGDRKALELMRRRVACLEASLEEMLALKPEDAPPPRNCRSARCSFYTHLTLDYGIERLRFTIDWLNSVIAKVERGDTALGARAAFDR